MICSHVCSMRVFPRAFVGVILAAGLLAVVPRSEAQTYAPDARSENVAPYFGGILPPGGYPNYSGYPLGGYTPYGVQGPEAGWLKIHWHAGYVEWMDSLSFGDERVYGPRALSHGRFAPRYYEVGRGPWNSYGDPRVQPPIDIWYPDGRRPASLVGGL